MSKESNNNISEQKSHATQTKTDTINYDKKERKPIDYSRIIGLCMIILLSFTFMTNMIDFRNKDFTYFQKDSEFLVLGALKADSINTKTGPYGLAKYIYNYGKFQNYNKAEFLSNDTWDRGYLKATSDNKKPHVISFPYDDHIIKIAKKGCYIRFSNGDTFKIKTVTINGNKSVRLALDTDKKLSYKKHGDLSKVQFLDKNKLSYVKGGVLDYISQYGLQGKTFRTLAKFLKISVDYSLFNVLCSILTAIVLINIVFIIYHRYNIRMAACYFITFLLSPWIVNFARNLYWVEFTWFLPMLIGLICAWKLHNKKIRIICYIGSFISIWIKCLCGYEYITTIMLGMISFLLIDFFLTLWNRNLEEFRLLFKTIFISGMCGLLGFISAICMHAYLRGKGNIAHGIEDIYKKDVLRRTMGGNVGDFPDNITDSLNATIFSTLRKYFSFDTDIIMGLSGKVFPILCLIPIGIFIYQIIKRKLNKQDFLMYIVLFITSISWFVLGKAHSYIHTHMNFVLWYFGFVQICFYIIIEKIYQIIINRKKLTSK